MAKRIVDSLQRRPDMNDQETAMRFQGYYDTEIIGLQPDAEKQLTLATLTEEQSTKFPDQLRMLAEAIQFDSLFASTLFKIYAEALENSTSPESKQEVLQKTADLYRAVLEAKPEVTSQALINKIAGIRNTQINSSDEE